MIRQPSVVAGADKSSAGFYSAESFVRLLQERKGCNPKGCRGGGGDERAVDLLPVALELDGAWRGGEWAVVCRREFEHRSHHAV